jgi:pyruvate/2-oxoglutarate dehydrogenase complex dihydrolipoamide dehydrogenase (E3) component
MTVHDMDVVVLVMGPGGEDAAERLATAGLSVAGVEARLVGGECPYWGCVPSKMMIRAADLLAEGRRVPGLAGQSQIHPDWAPVARRIREEATDNWDDKVAVDRFTGKGGTLFRGHGTITGPGEVTVGGDVLRARRAIIINTGTHPYVPPIEGLAGTPYWTNREAIEATEVPGSLVVLGAGPVGAELAQVFARFGARVAVIEDSGRLLPQEEPEAGALLAEVFGREGIEVRTGTTARAVRHDGTAFTLALSDGTEVTGDALLIALRRRTDLPGIGAGVVGVDESAHAIPVDDHLRAAPGSGALRTQTVLVR